MNINLINKKYSRHLIISPVILGLLLGFLNFTINPLGHTSFTILGKQPKIRTPTLITMCFMVLVLYYFYYPHLPLHIRFTSSTILPGLGLFFQEFLWHYGCWRILGGGIPTFWLFYCGAIMICIYFLNSKYDTLDLQIKSLLPLGVGLFLYILSWEKFVVQTDFYPHLLLYDQGLASDPHTPHLFSIAIFGWLTWMLMARVGEKSIENPRL